MMLFAAPFAADTHDALMLRLRRHERHVSLCAMPPADMPRRYAAQLRRYCCICRRLAAAALPILIAIATPPPRAHTPADADERATRVIMLYARC